MRVLEWQVEWAPDNARATVLLAAAYAGFGRREEAQALLDRAVQIDPDDAHTLYNVACTYAMLGLKKEALFALKRCVLNGYWHFDVIERDPDLFPLHDEPEFQELIRRGKIEPL